MQTYKYTGEAELIFPFVTDANGIVIVLNKGDVFEAPEGLLRDDCQPIDAKAKPAPVASPAPAVDPAPEAIV